MCQKQTTISGSAVINCATVAFLVLLWGCAGVALEQPQGAALDSRIIDEGNVETAYDGEWWLTISDYEQYGFAEGFVDCFTYDLRSNEISSYRTIDDYVARISFYFMVNNVWRERSVYQALRPGDRQSQKIPEVPASAKSDSDGGLWREWGDPDPTIRQRGFVAGYLLCHQLAATADAKFSRDPSEYVQLISEWYGFDVSNREIDWEKSEVPIGDVLHKFAD